MILPFRGKATAAFGGLLVYGCWAIFATLGGADGARIGEGRSDHADGSSNGGPRSLLTVGRLANASSYSYYVQMFVSPRS